jgi:signal transduction histidine kinase
MRRPHPVLWLRAHPRGADALLAALVASLSATFHLTIRDPGVADPSVAGLLLAVAASVPIAFRRRWPEAMLVATLAAQFGTESLNAVGGGWIGVLVLLYTIATTRSGPRLYWTAGVALVSITAFVLLGVAVGSAEWQEFLSTVIVTSSAVVFGDNMRRRRERASELLERAERAERERELIAEQRVQHERTRIAREMHDVVAHSVSAMVIQAGAARRQLQLDPQRALAALESIEATGRDAMSEMRRILGVLRSDDSDSRAPQPSLAALSELTARTTDLPVVLTIDAVTPPVPPAIELGAYRVVQEALTNVRRHAGPVGRVEIAVRHVDDDLVVEVVDDGRGCAAAPNEAGGYGITGMRERVAVFDGELQAGPRRGGGWQVRARFPLRAAS